MTHDPIKYKQFFNRSIQAIDGTKTGATTPGQSELESNFNEGVLHTQDVVYFHNQVIPFEGIGALPSVGDSISIF